MPGRSAHGIRGAHKPAITTPPHELGYEQWAWKQDHGALSLERFAEFWREQREKQEGVKEDVQAGDKYEWIDVRC